MKIGIVTVQDSNNFGSFLQAYALQYLLLSYGHEIYFLRTRSQKYIRNIFFHLRPTKNELKHMKSFIKENIKGYKKYRRFKVNQKCFKVLDDYTQEKFDCIVLGSDEIWNVGTPVFKNSIFYGLGMKSVMAYATSIGNANYDDMTCIPQEWFVNISPILVRDEYTRKYLQKIDIDSKLVVDPTLLVDRSIFEHEYNNSLLDEAPYILIYSYGLDNSIVSSIKEFSRINHLRLISVCFSFDWCDYNIDCSPLDFCTVLQKAKYVITSTFHGTIFAIINHKQFVSLPVSRKTTDLLKTMNLESRIIDYSTSYQSLQNILCNFEIDYDDIDKKISNMRTKSLELLLEGIKRYE